MIFSVALNTLWKLAPLWNAKISVSSILWHLYEKLRPKFGGHQSGFSQHLPLLFSKSAKKICFWPINKWLSRQLLNILCRLVPLWKAKTQVFFSKNSPRFLKTTAKTNFWDTKPTSFLCYSVLKFGVDLITKGCQKVE